MFKVHNIFKNCGKNKIKISKHFMFKVHYDNLEDVIEMSGISKHFMFKVHSLTGL